MNKIKISNKRLKDSCLHPAKQQSKNYFISFPRFLSTHRYKFLKKAGKLVGVTITRKTWFHRLIMKPTFQGCNNKYMFNLIRALYLYEGPELKIPYTFTDLRMIEKLYINIIKNYNRFYYPKDFNSIIKSSAKSFVSYCDKYRLNLFSNYYLYQCHD